MEGIARPLFDERQIEPFLVGALDIKKYLTTDFTGKKLFPDVPDVDMRVALIAQKIKEANSDLFKVTKYNTFDSQRYRAKHYKSDTARGNLRKEIFDQLTRSVRPEDDDKLCFGNGGMLPRTGELLKNHKAYIIIGLPASGKSSIAAKLSDRTGSLLIDSDFAKRTFPEFVKLNGATLVHKESKLIADEIRKSAIFQGVNIVLPIIGADYPELLDIIKSLKSKKYSPHIILVELDRIKAAQRALSRFLLSERYLPLNKIVDEYAQSPALTYYKLREFAPREKCLLIDTDVDFKTRYKKVSHHNCEDLFNML